MRLINKRVDNLNTLIERQGQYPGLAIYGNKNEMSSFCNTTSILIVGTYIPHDLIYFYFGKYSNRIYGSIIDVARNTDFGLRRIKILNSDNSVPLLNGFINQLEEQRIAFLDLFAYTLISPNEVQDRQIEGFVVDVQRFQNAARSENLRLIVPISKDADEILRSIIGNDPRIEYHQLINGGTNAEWIELFHRELL